MLEHTRVLRSVRTPAPPALAERAEVYTKQHSAVEEIDSLATVSLRLIAERTFVKRFLALFTVLIPSFAENAPPLLFSSPALGKTQIVFSYAGDLWAVPREGGNAVRLTAGPGIEANPVFSPDGSEVAFSGEYEGNVDVYTVSVGGGIPRRLTYHPGRDVPVAWTPDGKSILFRSGRENYAGSLKLFTVPAAGGFPESLPLPSGWSGIFSPDASRLAYMPTAPANTSWKRYRGGRTTPIWIAKLADSSVIKIPEWQLQRLESHVGEWQSDFPV